MAARAEIQVYVWGGRTPDVVLENASPRRKAVVFAAGIAVVIAVGMTIDIAMGGYLFTPIALIVAILALAVGYITSTRRRGR